MTTDLFLQTSAPVAALDVLIARHGLVRVLLALPAAWVRQRRDVLLLQRPVSYHIARDIGLSYEPPRKDAWEYR